LRLKNERGGIMKTPLVTVLTTTYNHSEFIANCIRSVLAQTYDNWEQIIVDDGSTDNTGKIVEGFDDERIVYVRQKHVGVHRLSETYNHGLKLAKGELIAILEGDDMFPRRKLELQIDSLADDTILSFGKCIEIKKDGKFLGINPPNFKRFIGMTDWLRPLIVYDYITGGTVMVKKEALIKIGGFIQPPNTAYVDYSTYLELALIGKFKFVNEILGIWVRHRDSYSDSNLFSNVTNKYSIQFCKKHGIPIDWKALSQQQGRDLFHIARHQLLDGNKKEAMKNFKRSFRLVPILGKFKSLGGMVASTIGLDLERMAGSLGRPTER
jgi:glycosyltransferase involved in cell wall biosynthesis